MRLGEKISVGLEEVKIEVREQLGDGFVYPALKARFAYMEGAVMGLGEVVSKDIHVFCWGDTLRKDSILLN